MALDGTYGIVYAGHLAVGIGIFVVKDGKFLGSDAANVQYEGTIVEEKDGSLRLNLKMHVPAGVWLVQGTSEQPEPYTKVVAVEMPANFGDGRPFETVLAPGPVTAIVKRVPDDWALYAQGFNVSPRAPSSPPSSSPGNKPSAGTGTHIESPASAMAIDILSPVSPDPGGPIRAAVYFRRMGEWKYRKLASRQMNALPAVGGMVTVDVDGKPTRARVVERYEFVPREHEPAPEPSLYVESV